MAGIEIKAFGTYIDSRRQSIAKLKEIAAEIQLHNRNKKISNITGATAGIVGSGLGIAGFGLTFVFPPVGLGLMIVGAALGGAGGATGGGATLLVHVLSIEETC
ncbi:unnamed protein product [Owenia fusiformis]|uniref:Uncharacterized protein n=1 Tax=Owenia fusiformis TaxID=6347 RepID=A0A8S4NI99_OWEFU|nr:unnamed protein product [Owenia fusiformis]